MKKSQNNVPLIRGSVKLALVILLTFVTGWSNAQDSATAAPPSKSGKPVKNTFNSIWIIDNQTVMVPIKGTFEFDIQHRFGTVENGYEDFFGLFAPSNIRLGFNYAPIEKLNIGVGLTKDNFIYDFNAKYAWLQQTTDNRMPISLSIYGNMAIDGRDASNFRNFVDRISYFTQVMIARKVNEDFSLQVAPSFTWFNNVEAYVDENGEIQNKMNNGHFAIAFMGRYRVSPKMAILLNYDQPLTQHTTNNPHPNLAAGLELTTSSHGFQIIFGNYKRIIPQYNNMYNQNDYRDGQFVIGFNMTRLFN